jgi:endonuclease/exonuclease/phosphatase family metal-dependent hydrolase
MELSVMTYNVRYFGHAPPVRGAMSSRKALRAIAEAIARSQENPHVICLQEVETHSLRSMPSKLALSPTEIQLDSLIHILEMALDAEGKAHTYKAYYFPAHDYRLGKTSLYTTGLAILLRDDIRVVEVDAKEPAEITYRKGGAASRFKQSRICAHLQLALEDGRTFDIFNTHLSLPDLFPKNFYRVPSRMGFGPNQQFEVDALIEYVNRARASDRFILVGDFNSLPCSPAYNRLLNGMRIHDPFPEALGLRPDQVAESWPTAGFFSARMRLDHVFVGEGVRRVAFRGCHPYGVDGHWNRLSDHVPLIGHFELGQDHLISTNSTSNNSVEFAGITGGKPRAP